MSAIPATSAWSEARGSNPASRACRARVVTSSLASEWSKRRESNSVATRIRRRRTTGASAWRWVRGQRIELCLDGLWDRRRHQTRTPRMVPRRGFEPRSHRFKGERPCRWTSEERSCRRSESNALLRAYGAHAVPNVIGVAGLGIAPSLPGATAHEAVEQDCRSVPAAPPRGVEPRRSDLRRVAARSAGEGNQHPWKESNLLSWLRRPAAGSTDRGIGVS